MKTKKRKFLGFEIKVRVEDNGHSSMDGISCMCDDCRRLRLRDGRCVECGARCLTYSGGRCTPCIAGGLGC